MKRLTFKTIFGIAAAIMALTSCAKDETLRYYNVTMGNVVDGRFVSDQGNIFNVTEQLCPEKIDTMNRVLVNCDILRQTAGTTNEYDVRLTQAFNVLAKETVAASSNPSDETLGNDPIHLENLWISGGYINMSIIIPVKTTGGRKHLINLVFSDDDIKDNTYRFTIRHNAYGEVLGLNNGDKMLVRQFVSFPIAKLINKDSANIDLRWKGYKTIPGGLSSESEDYIFNRGYLKSDFEQVPARVTGKNIPGSMSI